MIKYASLDDIIPVMKANFNLLFFLQVIDLLTTDELMKTLPQVTIRPRIFSVRPKQSLFIAGLSRIDVLDCDYRFCR